MEKLDRSDSSLFLVQLPRGRDEGSSERLGSVVSVSDGGRHEPSQTGKC
jgi:hypothetical protein